MQLQAKDADLMIAEVPISCSYNGKTSTHDPFHHGIAVLASIVRYVSQRHPLSFFGIPGFLSVLTGIFLGARVLYMFNSFGSLPTGTALLAVIFILAGIFSLFTGIILFNMSIQIARIKK
jgi:hypothetical protein